MPGNRRGGLGSSASASSSSSPSRSSKNDDSSSSGGLVFLHHGQSSTGSAHKAALTTAARAHASRRGHSKSSAATKKSFRFVPVQGGGPSAQASNFGHVGTIAGDGSVSSSLSSRQSSIASTSGATATSMSDRSVPMDHAMINLHHFHQHQLQDEQDQQQQQQQQQQNFIIIDSTRAIVAAAGDINPPRSLSADSWDPFDSLAVHNLSHSEQFMLHYALTTTWAKFGESQTGQQELAQSWIWATIESPAALFAQVAGAAAHYLTVPYSDGSAQRKAFTTSLQAKHKALKALQYELDRFHRQQDQQQLDKEQRYQQRHQTLAEDGSMSRQDSQYSRHHHHHQDYEHGSPAESSSSSSSAPSPASTVSVQGSYMTSSQAVQPVSANAAAAAGATDSMVLAILVLAVHDSIDLTPVPEPHPLAPLAMYRDMHIYGQMRMRDEHMTALYSLVEQKGGLPRMNHSVFGYVLPPLADLIRSADMLYNLRSGTAPRVPCHRRLLPMRDTPSWQPDPRARFLLGMVGSRFSSLQCPHRFIQVKSAPTPPGMFAPSYSPTTTMLTTVMVGLEEEVLGLLSVMAELTVAFDHYVRGERGAPRSLDFFVNNADLVAHRMMSLGSLLDEDNDIVAEKLTNDSRGKHRSQYTVPESNSTATSDVTGRTSEAYEQQTPSNTASKSSDTHSSGHKSDRKRKTKALPRHIILREISRRAAMVFQDMVIFPTPARTGVKLRHAAAMLPLLRALRPKRGAVPSRVVEDHVHRQSSASTVDERMDVVEQQGHSGYDYLLGEDLGRLHLQPHHHSGQHEGELSAGNGGWWDSQLEVTVKFDVGGGEVYDEDGMLRVAQLSPSPTPSPSQHNAALPGQPQQHQHHNIHQQQRYKVDEQTDSGPRPPTIPGEDDFLSWATLLGAIATRFTSLHDAYVEQLAADIDHREEELRSHLHHHQNPAVDNHFVNPAMGPCHYPVQGLGASTGQGYGSPEGENHAAVSSGDASAESWIECHTRMMRFLWLDSVCNEPGLIVWNEALVWRKWRGGVQEA